MGEFMEGSLDEAWSDLDATLRSDACDLFARATGERSERRLLSALDDVDNELRAAAARALGKRGCAAALPALVRRLEAAALEDELEAEEELNALVDALVELAHPKRSGAEFLAADAIELLSARLEGAVETVRFSIATVLGRIGRHEDAELVTSLLKDPSPHVRRAAVEALSRLEPGMASEPLRLALADESPLVRIAAAAALGGSENLKVIDDLQRLLQDEDPRVCAAAIRAIGTHSSHLDDPNSVANAVALIEATLTGEGVVAVAALEALRCIGGNGAATAAVSVLGRPEPEIVQAAVSCIAQHGGNNVVAELLAMVSHPNWGVRADVIQTLADRRIAQAVPPILRRLETEQDSFVRETILRALKRLEG
jgi:HEAT repeat protein